MHQYSFWEKLLFPPTFINEKKLRIQLEGKTILITGASSGIGEKLAFRLADHPVHMILVARTEEKLVVMKKEIESKAATVTVFRADLRNKEEVEGLLTLLHQLPDGLDFFVSNAGKSIRRSLSDSLDRYHDFTRTMAINYLAPVQLLLSVIPLLQQKQGQIVNISTVNVWLIPFPQWSAYQASKSAFDIWFRSNAPELNAMGITTTSIYLPLVRTPMILPTPAYQKMPAMSAEHAAGIICKTMYTRKRTYKPWWLIGGQWSSLLFRPIWERFAPIILRKRRK